MVDPRMVGHIGAQAVFLEQTASRAIHDTACGPDAAAWPAIIRLEDCADAYPLTPVRIANTVKIVRIISLPST